MLLDFGETIPEIDVDFGARLAVFGSIHGASIRAIAESKKTRRLKLTRFKQRQLYGVVGEDNEGQEFLFLPRKTTANVPCENVYLCPTATDVESFSQRDKSKVPELLTPLPLDPKKTPEQIAALRDDIAKSWSGGEYLKLCVWRSAHAVKTGHLLNRSG